MRYTKIFCPAPYCSEIKSIGKYNLLTFCILLEFQTPTQLYETENSRPERKQYLSSLTRVPVDHLGYKFFASLKPGRESMPRVSQCSRFAKILETIITYKVKRIYLSVI